MKVLGGGNLGSWLDHKGKILMNDITALISKMLVGPFHHTNTQQEGTINQKAGHHQILNCLHIKIVFRIVINYYGL